ncbi:Alpha/Beta hydrolase protein [Aspergillus cavernicola]|uniref:Carboxylic ester hydrolase n=1 Tax=Aspergillus cavernicola TaxID=176166 RepID=A0ABR4IG62_9EURO
MRFRPRWFLFAISLAESTVASLPSPRGPIVDLGYAAYRGYFDSAHGLNIWKGIRYAAPPVGKLRWQVPVAPHADNGVVSAVDQPPVCPQSGAARTPAEYGFVSGSGDEDCLFLNVYASLGASDLPVLVWIHGGGYSVFGATNDPSPMMNTNDNQFITVEIQYRLGAFGYLSSEEVKSRGHTNVGLLDQRFALEWVQKHIVRFGGDPSRVTIGGESSGAGSAMLQALAYGGEEFDLFRNVIAASPYSPPIYQYNDQEPTRYYDYFAELAGCGSGAVNNTFDCLVDAPTEVLQNASGIVSMSGDLFGSFAFSPVVDEDFITTRPSQQLLHGYVSGQRILVGNNANDGVPLSDPNVTDHDALNRHIARMFPRFTGDETALLNHVYQTQFSQPTNDHPRFDTLGDSGPTALNQSEMATGLQQTAFNIYAETTFSCPAQWLAEAFSYGPRRAWKYQYSVTPAYHGADLQATFPTEEGTWPSSDFNHAFHKMWGNFIIHETPVISISEATGNKSNATVPVDCRHHGKNDNDNIRWPSFRLDQQWQIDLNTTGGTVRHHVVTPSLSYYLREGDGVVNTFRLGDAYSWEGGRGHRCAFWRGVSASVPQ